MLLQAIKNSCVLVNFQIGLSSLLSIQIREVLWQNHFSIEIYGPIIKESILKRLHVIFKQPFSIASPTTLKINPFPYILKPQV